MRLQAADNCPMRRRQELSKPVEIVFFSFPVLIIILLDILCTLISFFTELSLKSSLQHYLSKEFLDKRPSSHPPYVEVPRKV